MSCEGEGEGEGEGVKRRMFGFRRITKSEESAVCE